MRLVARHTSSSYTPFCLETSLIRRPSSPTARGAETAGPGTDGLDKHARTDVARDKLSNVDLKAKKPACIWVAWWRNGRASDLRSRGREFDPRLGRGWVTTLGKLFAPNCLDADTLR